ncbi:hypothetical protein O181_074449 [Austropuccinia psidii MF-1]|uniref:Reverse transcriptase RNase H-like domain-containing protein n=1 Tax=Austropuccinia psidii MF-1 TaxID=1389203 RepID=A0A9Q3F8L9_9BASI|nr:hypothetical protein [Austropuccinia psidii MF-1]
MGSVLSQVSDSLKHPIAFDSCKLLPEEPNCEIHDEELLGIVWSLKHRVSFLLSLTDSFDIINDHPSLQYFMSAKVLTCHKAFWDELLSEFHYTITYLPGPLETLPDALSFYENIYAERMQDFISNNLFNFQQIIKKDEVQQSNFFSVKQKLLSNFVEKIRRNLGTTLSKELSFKI